MSTTTMRAIRLTQWQSDPVLSEVPVPEPHGSEVLVEVAAAGLCRSDIHIMSSAPATYPYTLPFTLGHEIAGRVAALGPEASGVSEGDPVVVYSRWGCGECWQCRNGRDIARSEEHTSELQSRLQLVCRLLLEKKKKMTPSKSSTMLFSLGAAVPSP